MQIDRSSRPFTVRQDPPPSAPSGPGCHPTLGIPPAVCRSFQPTGRASPRVALGVRHFHHPSALHATESMSTVPSTSDLICNLDITVLEYIHFNSLHSPFPSTPFPLEPTRLNPSTFCPPPRTPLQRAVAACMHPKQIHVLIPTSNIDRNTLAL